MFNVILSGLIALSFFAMAFLCAASLIEEMGWPDDFIEKIIAIFLFIGSVLPFFLGGVILSYGIYDMNKPQGEVICEETQDGEYIYVDVKRTCSHDTTCSFTMQVTNPDEEPGWFDRCQKCGEWYINHEHKCEKIDDEDEALFFNDPPY